MSEINIDRTFQRIKRELTSRRRVNAAVILDRVTVTLGLGADFEVEIDPGSIVIPFKRRKTLG
jgi:hypothetical protein